MKETVSSILGREPQNKHKRKLLGIAAKLDRLFSVAESEDDWQMVYDYVFGTAQWKVKKL